MATAKLDKRNYIFNNTKGETLVKNPGAIDGQSFVIMDLEDCNVFVLDHTSQIQVDDCKNCSIFLGPCKGSVFFRDCSDCVVHTAARQFRTRDVHNMKFAVYCPTQPSIETSTNCFFSGWRGAYPGLSEHFVAAGLDPAANTWSKIYDFNRGDDLGAPHWIIEDPQPLSWVEVPIEGSDAPCENPVPRVDGAVYGAAHEDPGPASNQQVGSTVAAPGATEGFSAAPVQSLVPPGLGDEAFDLDGGSDLTGIIAASPAEAAEPDSPSPLAAKMVEIRAALEAKAAQEADLRGKAIDEARGYLNTFYKNRSERLSTNANNIRQIEKERSYESADPLNVWEKVLHYIHPTQRPKHGKDLSRYQKALFAAKAKNVVLSTHQE